MTPMIDLRSDTKSLPTAEMLQAIMDAELGDDVNGEDPTVNALEARCAELLGKEAAVLVPSGTHGNLVSIYTQLRPGDELICHRLAHLYHYERGGISAVCGALVRPIPGDYGMLDLDALADTLAHGDLHRCRTGMVSLENTHNNCGGIALTGKHTAAVAAMAHEFGAFLHIDGARIFNAAVALDVSPVELAAPADSITFCFSKSLGAPVGAAVCGSTEFIQKVRETRKLFGGGMRQAGIIAAPALWALENNLPKLLDDHRHARQIADTLNHLPGIQLDMHSVQTNMVYFAVIRDDINAPQLCRRLLEYDIKAGSRNDQLIRFVTHVNMTDADVATICSALTEILT
jgi:threonine aldolase